MSEDNKLLPVYVATFEFLEELRELGYKNTIELDDLIDLLDEDPECIEQMQPTIRLINKKGLIDIDVYRWMYPDLIS